jgi:hypothetical protein
MRLSYRVRQRDRRVIDGLGSAVTAHALRCGLAPFAITRPPAFAASCVEKDPTRRPHRRQHGLALERLEQLHQRQCGTAGRPSADTRESPQAQARKTLLAG